MYITFRQHWVGVSKSNARSNEKLSKEVNLEERNSCSCKMYAEQMAQFGKWIAEKINFKIYANEFTAPGG
jgi:hypothetical protein